MPILIPADPSDHPDFEWRWTSTANPEQYRHLPSNSFVKKISNHGDARTEEVVSRFLEGLGVRTSGARFVAPHWVVQRFLPDFKSIERGGKADYRHPDAPRILAAEFLGHIQDRHAGNYGISGGHLYTIDHGQAFSRSEWTDPAAELFDSPLYDRALRSMPLPRFDIPLQRHVELHAREVDPSSVPEAIRRARHYEASKTFGELEKYEKS